jgi:Cdc6-like AAA superfamily ATPase
LSNLVDRIKLVLEKIPEFLEHSKLIQNENFNKINDASVSLSESSCLSPLSKEEIERYQKGLIITDDIAIDPILDFKYYKQVITNIIKKSYPKFSIGVFGEWGTGKTTLMRNVYNELDKEKNNSIVPVWFNAWRYERENQFALFPLLQTIANLIPEEDDEKKKLKEAVGKFGRGFLKGLIKSIPEFASVVYLLH